MKDGKGPVAVALAALVATCVASFVIGSPSLSRRGDAAARAFLDAWRASRMATYVADYRFTRALPDGRRFEQATRTVQAPPDDRLIIGLGTVSGRLAGKIVRCASAPTSGSQCFTSVTAPPYADEVNAEVDGLASYVQGGRTLYRVIEFAEGPDGDCFRLDLAVDLPSPPYGAHALFCFDRGTHVPVRTIVERPEATDTLELTAVRGTVEPADRTLPTDLGQVVGVPGPTTTTATTTTTTPGG